MFRARVLMAVFAALVVAWLVATSLLFVWPGEDSPAHANAVVVLSGAHSERLDKGLVLMRHGVAPVLLISNGRQRGWTEANRLCDGHASFRVICFDAHPFNTRGEAEAVTRIAARRHWRSIVVVTSTYHVTRSRLLFERCFHGRVQDVGSHFPLEQLPEDVANEWAKLIYALTVARDC